jgi:uncharacterized protein YbjT (DUF2867 family)
MRIAIVAASGKTGTQLVKAALAAGHEVIAIARSPEKMEYEDPAITKRTGDGYNEASIVAALEGADAVITTVGKTNLRDKRFDLSTAAHHAVIAGMKAHKIQRLLVISSIGAAQGIKRKGLQRNIYLWLRRKYYLDMFQMEQNIAASDVDYTLLRAPLLYDGPAKNDYSILDTEDYLDLPRVSRTDIADFLIQETTANKWVNRRVTIADNETAQ